MNDFWIIKSNDKVLYDYFLQNIKETGKYSNIKIVKDTLTAFKLIKKRSILNSKQLYVVYNDLDSIKDIKLLEALNEDNFNGLVLIYFDIDRRTAFYKKMKNRIVNFSQQFKDELFTLICGKLSANRGKELFQNCLNNYTVFSLEIDKVKDYAEFNQLNIDVAYDIN